LGTNAPIDSAPPSPEPAEFDEFDGDVNHKTFDPLLAYNRVMYQFNDKTFRWVLNPVAKGYAIVTPVKARQAVGRAFTNLAAPVRIGNSALQGRWGKAGNETRRFLVNTTLGLVGFFDPANSRFSWNAPTPEDFGQTLGHYGAGSGFPIVLPFLGPSNLRDTLGMFPDGWLHPRSYFLNAYEQIGYRVAEVVNQTSLNPGAYESLTKDALDPYTLMRDAYEQNRNDLIAEDTPDRGGQNADSAAVAEVVKKAVDKLLPLLQNDTLPPRQKRKDVIAVLDSISDLELLAKLSLGRTHWAAIDDVQKQAYTDLFIETVGYFLYDNVAGSAVDRIIAGEPVRLDAPGRPKYESRIIIIAGKQTLALSLLFAERKEGWRAYDLKVFGISARKSYGSQYSHFLRNKEFDKLLSQMREKTAKSRKRYGEQDADL
jgi:phospholipid-binding lipoprotein MlaA